MDGLSGAASIAAIVSITTDIVASIARLHKLYQSIQDAPQDITSILHDLQQLCAAIQCVEEQGALDDALRILLVTCTQKVEALYSILEPLSVALQSSKGKKRIWNSFKAVHNKDRIVALRLSLEETKSTMVLVLLLSQSHRHSESVPPAYRSTQLKRNAPTVQDVEGRQDMLQNQTDGTPYYVSDLERQVLPEATSISLMITQAVDISASQPDKVRFDCSKYSNRRLSPKSRQNGVSVSTPFYTRTPLGSIYFQIRTESEDATNETPSIPPSQRQTVSLIWHPASWAIRWGMAFGMQISVLQSHMGWKYPLSPIRSVPDDSLIFTFCRSGNVGAVRELLSRGDASVSDTDSYGNQPLHFAVGERQLEMSRFLIESGADKDIRSYRGDTLLVETALGSPNWMSFVFLLEDLVDFSTADSSGWQLLQAFEVLDHGSSLSSCLKWLFTRHLDTRFDVLDFRVLHHTYLGAVMRNDCEAVELILSLCPGIVKYHRNEGTPLHLLTYHSYSVPGMVRILIESAGEDMHRLMWGETATSKAMKYWTLFRVWRSQLATLSQSFESILMRETESLEMPLPRQGWSFDSLQRLFNLPFRTTATALPDPLYCFHCEIKILRWDRGRTLVDPWWEHLVDRLKSCLCICHCLEESLEWLVMPAGSTIQKLCGLHDAAQPSQANEYERNDQEMLDRAPALHVDLDKLAANAATVAIAGSPFIEIWSNTSLSEGFYGNGQRKPNLPPSPETNALGPGSRKFIRTRDWEESSGMNFLWHKDIMARYAQMGGWTKRYMPGQLYCFHCMSMFENWTDEESCEDEEQTSATMPGTFPLS